MQFRRNARFDIGAPVQFTWGRKRLREKATGVTRDLGAGGIFIYSEKSPPNNSLVRCLVSLPPLDDREFAHVIAVVVGRVCRTESARTGDHGFAVRNRVLFLQDQPELDGGTSGNQTAFYETPLEYTCGTGDRRKA